MCPISRQYKAVNYFSKYPSRFFSWMMMVTHVFSSHCGRWLSKLLFMFGLDWASTSFYVSMWACVCVYLSTIVAISKKWELQGDTHWRKRRWVSCGVYHLYIFWVECIYECNNITQQYIDVAEIRLLAWQSINHGFVMEVIFSFVFKRRG